MASAADVANYIVRKFQESGDPVTNLKLQKLLYYVQGWHLGLFGTPAFEGRFEAWVHGPVVRDVYTRFRDCRWNPIANDVPDVALERRLKDHIDEVLDVYGSDSAWSLERRSHAEDPWIEARGGIAPDEECRNEIPNDAMMAFFGAMANAEDS